MKKNFILQFAEFPKGSSVDKELIEYDHSRNLSVIKGTNMPAVNFSQEATETFTKAGGEGVDSDNDLESKLLYLSDTETNTFHAKETSDSDRGIKSTYELMSTQTLTETKEVTDNDK